MSHGLPRQVRLPKLAEEAADPHCPTLFDALQELKELETHQLIKRTVLDTQPITVQYELTAHGQTLKTIIDNLTEWGMAHHQQIFGKQLLPLSEPA